MNFGEAYTNHGVSCSKMDHFLCKQGHQEEMFMETESSQARPSPPRSQFEKREMALKKGHALKFRKNVQVGSSSTVAIGTTAQGKGFTKFIPGPRLLDFINVHKGETDGSVTTKLVYYDFDDTTDTLKFSLDGTNWGPGQVITGNLFEHPFYFDDAELLWCRVSLTFASLDGADSSTSNEETGFTLTPTKDPDGYLNLVHPDFLYYGNGSQDAPSTNGDQLSADMLYWFTSTLNDIADGDSERCIAACRQSMLTRIWNIIKAHPLAEKVDTFMGMKLNREVLAFNGVRFTTSWFLPGAGKIPGTKYNLALSGKTRGSANNCSTLLGSVFGRDGGNFAFYNTVAKTVGVKGAAYYEEGRPIADDMSPTLALPYSFRVVPEDSQRANETLRIDGNYVFLQDLWANIAIDYLTD
jgi:hypothetical protein